MNLIRYADDFIITGRTKELLEGEVKPLVEQFLRPRGLELSPKKTVITHVEQGFDFLGQNVRKYPNGKLLIKPSKKNVKVFLDGIRKTIKAALGLSAAELIDWLNPKVRGWANYHRHVVSKRMYRQVDHAILTGLWRWARRRHPEKSRSWLKQKYFERQGHNNWRFFRESCDSEGTPHKVRLLLASRTPIQRHVKVKGEANPYDLACETYFEKREGDHMAETFRGARTLRFLWYLQRGVCLACNTKITRTTGWRLHYRVPRAKGGSTSADNRALLHPECHDRVHRQGFSVSPARLPKEAFEGPEPDDGQLSRPVLRGPAPSNGGRLLGSYGDGCRLLDDGKLRIQGAGLIKVKLHRPVEGEIKTVTIKRDVNHDLSAGWWWKTSTSKDFRAEDWPARSTTPDGTLSLPNSGTRLEAPGESW